MKLLSRVDKLALTVLVFERGDFILESLREYCRKYNIRFAVVVSGTGSLDICNLHFIQSVNLPPSDLYSNLEGPLEIGSLKGSIIEFKPHIHIVLSECISHRTYSAHPEDGSRCCYRLELCLLSSSDFPSGGFDA